VGAPRRPVHVSASAGPGRHQLAVGVGHPLRRHSAEGLGWQPDLARRAGAVGPDVGLADVLAARAFCPGLPQSAPSWHTGGADLAPVTLYAKARAVGEWRPREQRVRTLVRLRKKHLSVSHLNKAAPTWRCNEAVDCFRQCGLGDRGEPAVTVMLPQEDCATVNASQGHYDGRQRRTVRWAGDLSSDESGAGERQVCREPFPVGHWVAWARSLL
jgi:hypothetical protein